MSYSYYKYSYTYSLVAKNYSVFSFNQESYNSSKADNLFLGFIAKNFIKN